MGHVVFKAEQITCNFYTKAQTLQIQGKENTEQLKLNLIALANEKLTVEVPPANKKQNGGEASHLDSITANDDLPTVPPKPGPPVTDLLDHSTIKCSYVSHFIAQIAAIKKDLEVIKSLIMTNLSSAVVLVSRPISYNVKRTEVRSSIAPDHKAIFLGMELQSDLKRGPGTWKFNNTLLEDQDYIDLINFIYPWTLEKYKDVESKQRLWELIKVEL